MSGDRYGGWYEPSRPRRAEGGIAARSRRGKIGETWWADRWIAVLESFGWTNRLQRGRSYARSGQVLDFQIAVGLVTARVQGSRPKPYTVRIRIKPLSDREWERVTAAMAAQAAFAAHLLAGEMPKHIEEAFAAAKVSLFPRSEHDIDTDCSCPDWANPCKHIAAVYYILAEAFDRDPFLIFRLRGRTREQIVEALRKLRAEATAGSLAEAPDEAAQAKGKRGRPRGRSTEHPGDGARDGGRPASDAAGAADPPLESCLDRFWTAGEKLKEFRVHIAPPAVPVALLKRLGPPPFWNGERDFVASLQGCYESVTTAALSLAAKAFEPVAPPRELPDD